MKAIFVNESGGIPYAAAIVAGLKPIETRTKNMLAACIGSRVAIVRTYHGKNPLVIGYVDIVAAAFQDAAYMAANRDKTFIPAGSKYDNNGRGKWCYYLDRPEQCTPYQLPKDAVRHGRSWCEF